LTVVQTHHKPTATGRLICCEGTWPRGLRSNPQAGLLHVNVMNIPCGHRTAARMSSIGGFMFAQVGLTL